VVASTSQKSMLETTEFLIGEARKQAPKAAR
jgi:hypothetical protein